MNLFDIKDKLPGKELITILAKGEDIRIERIVSEGESSPDHFWYDQDEDELVFLLQGSARLEFESEEVVMKAGDYLLIPAHKKHRVADTSNKPPAVWLCVFGKGIEA